MKKILSLISLVAVLLAGGVMLGGCGEQTDREVSEAPIVTEQNAAPTQPETVPAVEEVTDASLEAELTALDSEMENVKTTGFEQTDLSDKDLGL